MPLLFDSHLDLAWNAISWKRDLLLDLDDMNQQDKQWDDDAARGRAVITLPEMRHAQVAVCLATLMGRVPYGGRPAVHGGSLDFPTHEGAYGFAHGQLAYYHALQAGGYVRCLNDRQSLSEHWQSCKQAEDLQSLPLGIIVAMEGCDPIYAPSQAEAWYHAGLRVASLVHYGVSKYASGTGADGPITAAGFALLDEFSRLGIVLDTTHLCDQSFFEAMDHYEGPVLASHQNCRQLVPGQRQFNDQQIQRVTERGGILGLSFDSWMLSTGWERGVTQREVVSLDAAVKHVDHICQLTGSDRHVAIGSDLDGGFGTEQCPIGLDRISDLQKLAPLLADAGYSDDAIQRIFGLNWLGFFQQHLPDADSSPTP